MTHYNGLYSYTGCIPASIHFEEFDKFIQNVQQFTFQLKQTQLLIVFSQKNGSALFYRLDHFLINLLIMFCLK